MTSMALRDEDQYWPPAILASYSTEDLISEAVTCVGYGASDQELKNDVRPVQRPLGGLRDVGTEP